jgi:hypothetical protein
MNTIHNTIYFCPVHFCNYLLASIARTKPDKFLQVVQLLLNLNFARPLVRKLVHVVEVSTQILHHFLYIRRLSDRCIKWYV